MSIGDDLGRFPITYTHLKVVELNQVSFEDMKEILVVLRLITNSPNLRELQISVSVMVLFSVAVDVVVCFYSVYCLTDELFNI